MGSVCSKGAAVADNQSASAQREGGGVAAGAAASGSKLFKMLIKKAGSIKKKAHTAFTREPPTQEYKERAISTIPARVRMFSGCKDTQTSADVQDVTSFGLPPVSEADKAGGACTNGILSTLEHTPDITFGDLLVKMRETLKERNYTQIPQLSTSNSVKLRDEKFSVWAPEKTGNHRAVLVGINYTGQAQGVLNGCVNDVKMMRDYIKSTGYTDGNIRVLADDLDLTNTAPTGSEIVKALAWLVKGAKKGDSLFFHYSGHGSQQKDDTGDEADGMDETLVPLDYAENGCITDDTLFQLMVAPLPAGVSLTCVFDCCHSGTILDLPFLFSATEESCAALSSGEDLEMAQNPRFDMDTAKALVSGIASGVFNQVVKAKLKAGSAAGAVAGKAGAAKGGIQDTLAELAGGLFDGDEQKAKKESTESPEW